MTSGPALDDPVGDDARADGDSDVSSASADAVDRAAEQPLVAAVADFARDELAPRRIETDRSGVTAETIDRLRDLGALNHLARPEHGGAGLGPAEDRRINEDLAAACLSTWLVWCQHAPLPGQLETWLGGAEPGHEVTRGLLHGEIFAGAALSDVRHYPERYVRATRVTDATDAAGDGPGWRFDGTVSWVTGWGLNTVLLTAGVDPTSETVVLALLPVSPAMHATPLDLAALGGSLTARVELRGATVPDALVVDTIPLAEWRTSDEQSSPDAKPQLFGLARSIVESLTRSQEQRARDLAEPFSARIAALRRRAYALADSPDRRDRVPERLAVRAEVGELVTSAARALVVARSGRGFARDDDAQYFLRSAHFLLVQAQTSAVRDAQLAALAARLR
ncbi:acyl-CoA dehydrogenase family protein [Frondihabitans australicus]|uniref:Alkylation response protein AidB-like acyl-CoA dehydrogenase n=1 Tax=Frondihabitans australicus TaxID=386892 RepID=A0A495IBS4_9MICO|nr:acyl-CoA dehydrogenase family protein [Frondihabitans australicus]RKR73447.1 alkylation response protein AidB-like acyl-CoA dehydrogenase [Frondihabitans australicus]